MDSKSTKNFTAALGRTLKDHSLVQLNSYFSKTPDCSDLLNKTTVSTLIKILKNDRKQGDISLPVQCVLSCLKQFLDSKIDIELWQEHSEDLSKLFDTTFALSATYIGDEALVHKSTTLFTDIVEHCEQLADDTIKYMLGSLLEVAIADKFASVRFEVVSFISVLLQKCSRERRREVVPSSVDYLEMLSDTLVTCGNYELQATTVEVLARCRLYMTDLQQSATLFPSSPHILDMFSKHMFMTFDSECRLFLNELNESLVSNKLVYSLPCMIIIVDNLQLRKPVDPLYSDFWVDFNSCPASISFYYLPRESENWDAIEIRLDCVLSVTAKKRCKAKNSDNIIDAVKLEIYRSTTPEHTKIYLVNDKQFETVENNILKKTLKDKYKREMGCACDSKSTNQPSSPNPVKSKDKELAEGSFINMSTIPEQPTTSKPKTTEKTVIDGSDQNDSPSPVQNTSTYGDDILKTLEDSDSKESDSFVLHIKKKEKDSRKDEAANDKNIEEDLEHDIAKNQSKPMHNSKLRLNTNTLTTKDIMENISKNASYANDDEDERKKCAKNTTKSILKHGKEEDSKNVDSDGISGETNEETKYAGNQAKHEEKENAKSHSKPSKSRKENDASNRIFENILNDTGNLAENMNMEEDLEIVNNLNVEKQQNHDKKYISNQSKTLVKLKPARITRGVKKSCNEDIISNGNSSQLKDNQRTSGANESISRKRLYSVQNNDTLVLSSQDDILSVDVPAYKISKKETKMKPQPNVNRKNVTYSYLNDKDGNSKKTKERNEPSLYVNEKDTEEESDTDFKSKESTRKQPPLQDQENNFKYSSRNEKKLEALNKTPENAKSSNIFPTVYSDFSGSVKKPAKTKTYARVKPKRGRKRILLPTSSDSDSDYDPDAEVPPKLVQTRGRQGKNANVKKPSGFADRLDKPKIDPTRDCSTKSRKMEVEKVPFEETIETRIIYQKETITAPAKRGKPKITRQVSKSKVISKPVDEEIEQISEDGGMDYEPDVDVVPSQSEELKDLMEDDWSLDVLINKPPSQDKKLLQASYKINDMVMVGKRCTTQVNTRLKKVHTLAQKEREMNISTFDYNVQASLSSVHTQLQKIETAKKTLASIRIALDSTFNLLRETSVELEAEAAQIENAKKELKNNLIQAGKTETSRINSIFQSFGRYMRNIVLSLLQANREN